MMLAAENLLFHPHLLARPRGCDARARDFLAALRLVERTLRPRQGFRLAQHLEAHRAGQRRDLDEANLDAVGELKTLAGLAAEQGARRFVEVIVVVAER